MQKYEVECVIKGPVKFGADPRSGQLTLRFNVERHIENEPAVNTRLRLGYNKYWQAILAWGVDDIAKLPGRTCIVEVTVEDDKTKYSFARIGEA